MNRKTSQEKIDRPNIILNATYRNCKVKRVVYQTNGIEIPGEENRKQEAMF